MEVTDKSREPDCPVLNKLPLKLRDRLLSFQREGIKFAVEKNGRCLIADEMGLGKTIQAISVAYYYKEAWPLLIIVPSSLKFCWVEELEKWLPDILPHQINLVQSGCDASGLATSLITIVTYGLLRLPSSKVIREAMTACKFKIIICDESHYLKSLKTLSTKTVIPLLKAATYRILLSGTPALSRPVELYPQIDAICPGKFGSFWQFTDRYCDAHTAYYGKFRKYEIRGASNLEELQQRLKAMLMIRREKSKVLTELPPKQRQRILFELKHSPLKKEIFDRFADLRKKIQVGDKAIQKLLQAERQVEVSPGQEGEITADNNPITADKESNLGVYSQISTLYKLSGEAKIGPVREYIDMLCDNADLKFLVFAYHHDMMDGIQQTLWDKKVKFVRIDGTTRSLDRQACVTQFQSDPHTRVAILSILAAGVGLTFTTAKLVVFAELYWTPGVMVQCEDRAHRIGQDSSLPVHYLVARGTMDEWVWSAICKKAIVTSTALMGKSRQLDHEEGDQHQIDVLSNADMWKPEPNQDVLNVAELVQSQRSNDQSSILHFFTSQGTPECKSASKIKHLAQSGTCHLQNSEIISSPPSLTKHITSWDDKADQQPVREIKNASDQNKASNLTNAIGKRKKLKLSEVLVISNDDDDDDDDFKPIRRRKKNSAKPPKIKEAAKSLKPLGANNEKTISKPPPSEAATWSCCSCTFLNHPDIDHCEMCDTPQRAASPREKTNTPDSSTRTMDSDRDSTSRIQRRPKSYYFKRNILATSSMKDNPEAAKAITDYGPFQVQHSDKHTGKPEARQDVVCQSPNLFDDCFMPAEQEQGFDEGGNKSLDKCHSPVIESLDSSESDLEDLSSVSLKATSVKVSTANSEQSTVVTQALSNIDSTTSIGLSIPYPPVTYSTEPSVTSENSIFHTSLNVASNQDATAFKATKSESCNTEPSLLSQTISTISEETSQTECQESIPLTEAEITEGSSVLSTGTTICCSKILKFSCSVHTGRIYVYDEQDQSLQANFHPIDVEMGNVADLPEMLQIPVLHKQLQKFVREWASLTDTKKRLIAKQGLIFASPLAAYEKVKTVQSSKQRHLSKEDSLFNALKSAHEVQGSVRVIAKHSEIPVRVQAESLVEQGLETMKGIVQAVTEQGVPLCLHCQKPYNNPLLSFKTICKPENAWQLRLCSYTCMDKYWTLTKASYCRDQIYDIEKGVCRLCEYDAHSLYTHIKITKDLAARAELIRRSPYHTLTSKQKQKMVEQPQAGQFWHVDHITPVWQGGGMCDLDNLRTLCTVCHLKVTRKQAGQRATMKKLSGAAAQRDITAFFQKR